MLRNLALTLLLAVSSFTATPSSPADDPVNKAAHHITMTALEGTASCSATAVGAHTLLTAAHCLMSTDQIKVDDQPAKVVKVLYDGADHALLILDMSFDVHLLMNQSAPNYPYVRMWGNPGEALHIYRLGVFVKIMPPDDEEDGDSTADSTLYVYQLAVYPGDSGSGLIADDVPEVVGVVALGNASAEAACFRLQFAPEQLAAIQ